MGVNPQLLGFARGGVIPRVRVTTRVRVIARVRVTTRMGLALGVRGMDARVRVNCQCQMLLKRALLGQ